MVTFSRLPLLLTALSQVHAVRFLGRVDPTTNELTWPGTGVAFTFTGTEASIELTSIVGNNSVALSIDSGNTTIISNVDTDSISTPSLAHGKHTVVMHRRSEDIYGTITIGNVTTDGQLGADVIPARQIEIVGDSISVGYGLDGVYPCTNTAALEDNPLTYGALAASSLGADYNVIAWSGIGLVRNYASTTPDDSPVMPVRYTKYGANDVANNTYTYPKFWHPQAVVINLGTNDFGYLDVRPELNITLYTDTMVSFVKTIQSHYPQATFFLMSSPMLSDTYPTDADAQHTTQSNALKAAITQLGSSTKAYFVDWPTQGSTVGCDFHPDAATHAAEAAVLEAAIKSALGW